MKKLNIFLMIAGILMFVTVGLPALNNNIHPAYPPEINNVDEKAMDLLNACQSAQSDDDIKRCITGLNPAVQMCTDYPDMKFCQQGIKLQRVLDMAEARFGSPNS